MSALRDDPKATRPVSFLELAYWRMNVALQQPEWRASDAENERATAVYARLMRWLMETGRWGRQSMPRADYEALGIRMGLR